MQHPDEHSAENLIHDLSFQDWVFERSLEKAEYWQSLYAESTDNQIAIEQARAFLLNVKGELPQISSEEISDNIQHILNQAEEKTGVIGLNFWQKNRLLAVAASVVFVIGASLFFWKNYSPDASVLTYKNLTNHSETSLTEIINDTEKPKLVNLSDGSSVMLQSNSRISFPKKFPASKREVYLSGEAFFEVAKNPSQPFFVYANELVAKVLGTSFSVRAYESDKEVKVVVKTGRVSVFSQSDVNSSTLKNNRELTGLVLTPNQRAVFQRQEIRIVRELVEKPDLLNIPIEQQNFVFKRSPLSEVFGMLEKAYGVDIVYDEELMSKCSITASLTDEPLFEKLQMICTAVEASYEEIDGQIVISSRGCN